jgi:hypothetical protein
MRALRRRVLEDCAHDGSSCRLGADGAEVQLLVAAWQREWRGGRLRVAKAANSVVQVAVGGVGEEEGRDKGAVGSHLMRGMRNDEEHVPMR